MLSRSGSPSSASEHDELASDLEEELQGFDQLRQHTEAMRRKLVAQRHKDQRQQERAEQRSRRNAQDTKRCQWKAASARYYENHPEVRERKRTRMAEQRAAKKLARRRWDPPKKSKCRTQEDFAVSPPQMHQDPQDADAAQLLLCLQRRAHNPFPDDLPPSDEIPNSEDEGGDSSG
ncbi:hypothetical protein B0H19DRAFT_1262408 [Mycena capillaripes]|nr:hypothetical protein B0H19DRAFT_1262408 [Mycena capillaripes]